MALNDFGLVSFNSRNLQQIQLYNFLYLFGVIIYPCAEAHRTIHFIIPLLVLRQATKIMKARAGVTSTEGKGHWALAPI